MDKLKALLQSNSSSTNDEILFYLKTPFVVRQSSPKKNNKSTSLQDPRLIDELVSSIESQYYDENFDTSLTEIEIYAGSKCRERDRLRQRLLILEKLRSAVYRKVSDAVIARYPLYQGQLDGVIALQTDNEKAMNSCIKIRNKLSFTMDGIVIAHFRVVRNYKRLTRLKLIRNFIEKIKTLQDSSKKIDSYISSNKLRLAVFIHCKCSQLIKDFQYLECSKFLDIKLKDLRLKIDDQLDLILMQNCFKFDSRNYERIQLVYECLQSLQTISAQLQMYFTSNIVRNSNAILHSYYNQALSKHSSNPFQIDEDEFQKTDINRICLTLNPDQFAPCISEMCQMHWDTLFAYNSILLWHSSRLNSQHSDQSDILEELSEEETLDNSIENDISYASQWHKYIKENLEEGKLRLWQEITSQILPILEVIKNKAYFLSFEHITWISRLIECCLKVGKEFCEDSSPVLNSAYQLMLETFFTQYHRKHMDRLKSFLETESWERIPLKQDFTLRNLDEFGPLFGPLLYESTNKELENNECENFFESYENPFKNLEQCAQFPVNVNCINLSKKEFDVESSPVVTSTSLEILRLFGQYIQIMYLLPSLVSDVILKLWQIFDYYFISIYHFFGPPISIPDIKLNVSDRLNSTLTRIKETTINYSKGNNSVDHVEHSSQNSLLPIPYLLDEQFLDLTINENGWRNLLASFLIATSSLEFLAKTLDMIIFPCLSESLKQEDYQKLINSFREESVFSVDDIYPPIVETVAALILQGILSLMNNLESNTRSRSETLANWLMNGIPRINHSILNDPAHWITNEVPINSSPWVFEIKNALQKLSVAINQIENSPGLNDSLCRAITTDYQCKQMNLLWMGINNFIVWNMLVAFGHIYECSREGRCQMLLDAQTLANSFENVSNNSNLPDLEHIINYIQAYYTPLRDFEQWLTEFSSKYTKDQLIGLANSMTTDCDKKTRTRLVDWVENCSQFAAR